MAPLSRALSLLSCVAAFPAAAAAADKMNFGPLQAWLGTQRAGMGMNISLTLGDASGPLYSFANGNMTLDTRRVLGSGSKWAASTAMLALIDAANASVDDKMSEHLDWWTTDEADPRSEATLRHFLTMTSGMVTDGTDAAVALNGSDARERTVHSKLGYGAFLGCSALAPKAATADLGHVTHTDCVRATYDVSRSLHAPGEYFMYATLTFNFVAAAMEAALGAPIDALLEEHFLRPLNFAGPWSSRVSPEEPEADATTVVPLLGGGLQATATEMDGFMRRMLRKDFLPLALHDLQETAETTFAQYSTQNQAFGPYGMGIWNECLFGGFDPSDPFPETCARSRRITWASPRLMFFWESAPADDDPNHRAAERFAEARKINL